MSPPAGRTPTPHTLITGGRSRLSEIPARGLVRYLIRLLKNPTFTQAAQKGPDARRRAKGRVRCTPGTPQRARERANAADGPFSAAC